MSVAEQLGLMLGLLAVGAVLRAVSVLTPSRRDTLTALAFYIALPALVFTSTVGQSLSEVVSWRLLVGVMGVLVIVAGVGFIIHRNHPDPARQGVAVIQSYHCNLGFLGVPFVAATFGELTTGKASIVLGIGSLVQVTLTVILLTRLTTAEANLQTELVEVIKNPVLVALALGLAGAAIGVEVPTIVAATLDGIGTLALPIALLSVGASLTTDTGLVDPPAVGAVAGVKLLLMPMVALAIFLALNSSPSTLQAGVLMLAMPTAVSTYIYTSELGGDRDLASATILATTVGAVVTLYAVVQLLALMIG
jgi:predicted permease